MSYDLKYRPESFSDVIGHDVAISSIKHLIKYIETAPHAWLLTGISGIGKTTVARIIAHELGADNLSIIEKNGADNRKIDDIRNMLSFMESKPPWVKSLVYIIDECHQLTKEAQNALLKGLEEPPNHVFFILCTTDDQKIISTIKTRTKLFKLSALSPMKIRKLLHSVHNKEDLDIDVEIIEKIIKYASGSPRMALNMLEKCSHLSTDQETADILLRGMGEDGSSEVEFKVALDIYNELGNNRKVGTMELWKSIMPIVNLHIYKNNVDFRDVKTCLGNLLGSRLRKRGSINTANAVLLLQQEVFTKGTFVALLYKVTYLFGK